MLKSKRAQVSVCEMCVHGGMRKRASERKRERMLHLFSGVYCQWVSRVMNYCAVSVTLCLLGMEMMRCIILKCRILNGYKFFLNVRGNVI